MRVHLGREGLAAGFSDYIAGFDTSAMQLGMVEEANILHHSHAGNQFEIAIGAEEGRFFLCRLTG